MNDINRNKEQNLMKKLLKKEVNEFGIKLFCLKCNKTYEHRDALRKHISNSHPAIKYHCDKCEFVSARNKFLAHLKFMHGTDISICSVCNKTYANRKKLLKHINLVHKSKTSLCNICGKVFKNHLLPRHMLTHRVEKPFSCNLCEFSTVKKYNLDVHMRAHERKGSGVYNRMQERKKYGELEKCLNT